MNDEERALRIGDIPYKDRGTQVGVIELIARHAKEFQNLKPDDLKRFELESEKFCNAMSPGGVAAWNPVDFHNAWEMYLKSSGAQELGTLDMTKLRVVSANMGGRSHMQLRIDTSLPGIYGVPQGSEHHDPLKVDLVGFDRISMAMALLTAKLENTQNGVVAHCLYPLLKTDGGCEGWIKIVMTDSFKKDKNGRYKVYPVNSQFNNFFYAAVSEKILEDQDAYGAMLLANRLEVEGIKDEKMYLKFVLDQVFDNPEGFIKIEGKGLDDKEAALNEIEKITKEHDNASYYHLGSAYEDRQIILYTKNKPNTSGTGYNHLKNMDPDIDPWCEKYFVVSGSGQWSSFIALESMEVAIKYPINHANGNVVLAVPELDRRGNLYTVRFFQFRNGDISRFIQLIGENKKNNPHHYEPIILSKKNKQ